MEYLQQAVEKFAKQEGISVNQFIANVVAEKVERLRMVTFFMKRQPRADVTREGGEAPLPEDVLD